ncbi:MAG: hypothetical protein JWL64_937 [Frankiales bacterium]|nr:hypothetical protein [Frankiales bacterium]
MDLSRARLAAGIAGPAAFVGAWVVGSAVKAGYSPVSDTISRLAEQGASTKPLMTSGFVAFGVLLPVFAGALRGVVPPAGRAAIALSGLGTLAVAATSLTPDGGHPVDTAHYLAAAVSYTADVVAPVLATRWWGPESTRRAYALSALIAACLGGSLVLDDVTGLLQRAGLTLFDAWAAYVAWQVLKAQRVGLAGPA